MKIFFSQFEVTPTKENEKYELVKGAYALCWIKGNSPQSALAKAEFYVSNNNWQIIKIKNSAIEVNEAQFSGRKLGKENYLNAIAEGVSIVYQAWSRDGKTTAGPLRLNPSHNFPLSE
jgi:hypothetical protein